MVKLGNISLEQLLTTALTVDKLEIPGSETTPIKPRKMEITGGGLKKGRERFAGLKNDYFITVDKSEKKLLPAYRKLNSAEKEKFLLDAK